MNDKRILFLTTTNLAANPRLTKELRLAITNGFQATVMQFVLVNWSDTKTKALEKEFPTVRFLHISATRTPFLPWLISSLLEKFSRIVPVQLATTYLLSMAVNKRTYLLLKEIKKIKESFSWVIAHNPGAFYPAQVAAKQTGALLGIDIEDYHPGETNHAHESSCMRELMQQVLPTAAYCSFAAPLIRARFLQELRNLPLSQLVILNGFEQAEFVVPEASAEPPLKCVWFSQFIDRGRGLESVLPLINSLYPNVELHLIGQMRQEFHDQFVGQNKGIVLHDSMKQNELHKFLSKFDVGFALEPGRDVNNQLAVSNKLMAFAQAGLFILATHTPAQDQFLAESKLDYRQTDLSPERIREVLLLLIEQKSQIRLNGQQRFEVGKTYAWERFTFQLINQWKKVKKNENNL